MIGSDAELERMQADGRISVGDADEVRNFSAFLRATAGIPTRAVDRTKEQQRTFIAAYREHYPEDYARAVAEQRQRSAPTVPGSPEPADVEQTASTNTETQHPVREAHA